MATVTRVVLLAVISLVLGPTLCVRSAAQTFSSGLPQLSRDWFNKMLAGHNCGWDDFDNCGEWGPKDTQAWLKIRSGIRDILMQTMYQERDTRPLSSTVPRGCAPFTWDRSYQSTRRQFESTPLSWTKLESDSYKSLPDWFRDKVEFAFWKQNERIAWSTWQSIDAGCQGSGTNGSVFSSTVPKDSV